MASDNLNELGKIFRSNREDSDSSTRRYSENYPMIECIREEFDPNFSYYLEFYTYKKTSNQVFLDIMFLEEFDEEAKFDFSLIPLVVTQTGINVGFTDAHVGIEGVWYPLIQLMDLSFTSSTSYSVIFDIEKFGTGTYQHKIVFDGGGVDLTSATTIAASTITVNIVGTNVTGGSEVLDAYIYGRVTGFSGGGWLYYAAANIFNQYGQLYTPRGLP